MKDWCVIYAEFDTDSGLHVLHISSSIYVAQQLDEGETLLKLFR